MFVGGLIFGIITGFVFGIPVCLFIGGNTQTSKALDNKLASKIRGDEIKGENVDYVTVPPGFYHYESRKETKYYGE